MKYTIKSREAQAVLGLVCFALSFATVLLRLLSGVHWLTDIAAGVFLGTALVELYTAASGLQNNKEADK